MPTLHWLTRDEDLRTAFRMLCRLLEEAPALSVGEPDTGNMLIQGDNLEYSSPYRCYGDVDVRI